MLIFLVVVYYIIYTLICNPNQGDYQYHVIDYYKYNHINDFYTNNNLLRYLLNICHLLNFDLIISASFILSFFIGVRLFFYYHLLNTKSIVRSILAISFCLIMPLINIGTGEIYVGNWVGNIWHSPTFIPMMAFAPICIFYFNKVIINGDRKKSNLIAMSLAMFLCCFSKPSFIIVFIPACLIWIVIDGVLKSNKNNIIERIKIGLLVSSVTLVFLLIAFIFEYTKSTGGDKIIVAPFWIWEIFVKNKLNILFSIISSLGIGISIYIINKRYKDSKSNFYSLLLLIGMLYFIIFAEEKRYYAANFSWSYSSAGLMFIVFLLIDFFNNYPQYKKNKLNYAVIILFLLQIINGVCYMYMLYTGSGI